jgi:hypothetical protein
MSGAISALKISGLQDKNLTDVPQLNFIKNSYMQYNKISTEKIKVEFDGIVDFNKQVSCILPDKADYISKIYLCISLPELVPTGGTFASWTNSIGHAIIDHIDLEIGNRLIDRHYGLFMEIWEELTGKDKNENLSIGKTSNLDTLKQYAEESSFYIIPLRFWFCEELESALPLYALKYHRVKITIKFKGFSECVNYDGGSPPTTVSINDAYLMCDYIYMQRKPHKIERLSILITQTQIKETSGEEVNHSGSVFKTNLPFNHPVKELLWVFIEKDSIDNNDPFNFSQRNTDPSIPTRPLMKSVSLFIDGSQYFKHFDEKIYRTINSYTHHTNTTDRFIYTFPFCQYPERHQPSGTLNFSCIDSFTLNGEMQPNVSENYLYVFGINYNWLEIENGVSALKYII